MARRQTRDLQFEALALLGLWLSVGVMGGSILAGQLHAVGDLRRTRTYGFALAGMLALLATVNSLGFWRTPVVQFGALHLVVPVVLELDYSDDSSEEVRIPVEVWRKGPANVAKLVATPKTLARAVLFSGSSSSVTQRSKPKGMRRRSVGFLILRASKERGACSFCARKFISLVDFEQLKMPSEFGPRSARLRRKPSAARSRTAAPPASCRTARRSMPLRRASTWRRYRGTGA